MQLPRWSVCFAARASCNSLLCILSVITEQPYPEWYPVCLHFNHSLWSVKTNENAMYDSSQADSLSGVTRWWVAGLLKHAPALMALCCPTVNCYRRLGGCFAPAFSDWAIDDRDAAIRVKNYAPKVRHSLLIRLRFRFAFDTRKIRLSVFRMADSLSTCILYICSPAGNAPVAVSNPFSVAPYRILINIFMWTQQ